MKKVLLKGPVLTRSGYGEQARFALRSLRSREDLYEIYIHPTQWGQTSWDSEDSEERHFIDERIEATIGYVANGGTFDMSIQVTIPNEFEILADYNVGYTAGIETTDVSHTWIQYSNVMDKMIVVSEHSKQVFEKTKYDGFTENNEPVVLSLETPISSIGYPVREWDNLPELELGLETSYNFLTVAQFGPRKNLINTIRWFVEEFRDEDVGLVLKSNIAKNSIMDRSMLSEDLRKFIEQLGEMKCKVYLLHGDMTSEEIHSLYHNPQIDAYVSFTYGEGFGLPLFEAAYSNLPVVATGWSGQLDFLVDSDGKDQFYNVAFDINRIPEEVVWDGVLIEKAMWSYPREQSARQQMRLCYEDGLAKTQRWDTSELHERFSQEKMFREFIESL